jgi:hypothetical protein
LPTSQRRRRPLESTVRRRTFFLPGTGGPLDTCMRPRSRRRPGGSGAPYRCTAPYPLELRGGNGRVDADRHRPSRRQTDHPRPR